MLGSYPRTRAIRAERRARAEEVQARSASLSPEERLAKLDSLGLIAAKERFKLARKIKQREEEAAALAARVKKNKKK